MKNIFMLMPLLIFIPLISMDPVEPYQDKKQIGIITVRKPEAPIMYPKSYFNGSTTSIGQTKIFVTKEKIVNADGLGSIIAGTKTDFENSSYIISSPHTQTLKEWQAVPCIDNRENDNYAQQILGWVTETLDRIKNQNPNATSIVLSSLGTKFEFRTLMTITVVTKAIGEFIEKNPNAYTEIVLCVKKESLVTRYIECIENFKQHRALLNFFD